MQLDAAATIVDVAAMPTEMGFGAKNRIVPFTAAVVAATSLITLIASTVGLGSTFLSAIFLLFWLPESYQYFVISLYSFSFLLKGKKPFRLLPHLTVHN